MTHELRLDPTYERESKTKKKEHVAVYDTLSQYRNSNFRCGNTRTALANWDTRISEVAAP